jgi:hypothetical protein
VFEPAPLQRIHSLWSFHAKQNRSAIYKLYRLGYDTPGSCGHGLRI